MTLRSAWPRVSAALLATVAVYVSGGCSFFYDLNTTQCEVPADCKAFGAQFANTTCVNRVCVPIDNETGGSTSTGGRANTGGKSGNGGTSGEGTTGGMEGDGGTVSSGGTGTGGDAGAGGTPPEPECRTNADCIEANLDAPHICRDEKCVKLITTECPLLLPTNGAVTILKDKIPPIVLGGFASMTNKQDPHDTKAVINWDMAFDEFDTVLSVAGTKIPRAVGLICQGAAALIDLDTEMAHLTQDVGVPGIVSTLSSDDLARAWEYTQTQEYTDAKLKPVFFMSTGSADLRLANLNDGGLVWHLLGDPRGLAATASELVQRIEPHVKAMRQSYYTAHMNDAVVEDPNTPLRVTLVFNDDPTMTDVASVLSSLDEDRPETMLTFNGKPAIDETNRDNFRQVKVESSKYHSSPPAVIANGVTELLQNPPHIIVAMGTGEFGQIMTAVESNWGKTGQPSLGKPRPFYVLSHFILSTASTDLQAPMAQYAGATPPINLRSVGVAYALAQDDKSKALYSAYLSKLRMSYTGMLDVAGSENHYDGAYSLLYSTLAAAPFSTATELDGVKIENNWEERIIGRTGISVNIGQSQIADTLTKLSTLSYKASLWGTMGPPVFDRSSGTRTSATSAWCMQLKSGSASVWEAQIDGLIYDSANKVFVNPTSGSVPACLQQY